MTIEQRGKPSGPIADMRDAFARKTPQTEEDRAQARAFIDSKIEMIRRDPYMTGAEKAAAIADLEPGASGPQRGAPECDAVAPYLLF